MNSQHVDYVTTYFPHKNQTKIQGEPSHDDLKRLKMELRADASSVDSDLGGGNHGYLGLVLSDVEYLALPGVGAGNTFQAPVYPAALVIPATSTAIRAMELKEAHRDAIRNYRQCQHVEKALLNHLQKSLESKYLDAFMDDDTALLNADIPDILAHLFLRYGQVTGEEVKAMEAKVMKTVFAPADPLVLIWNPIEKLKKLAIQANLPYTPQQLIDLAMQLIKNTHDFELAIGEWNQKGMADKTWTNLKSHFGDAQKALKDIRGPTMAQAGFHQINHVAEEMRDSFQITRSELANMMAVLQNEGEETAQPESYLTQSDQYHPTANAVVESDTQVEILKLLQAMQGSLMNSNANPAPKNKVCKKTPDNPNFTRRITRDYCWTHGMCAHKSSECRAKAKGHKNAATNDDKLGGSKAFCE